MKKNTPDTPWAGSWAATMEHQAASPRARIDPNALPVTFRNLQIHANVMQRLGTAGYTQAQAEAAYAAELAATAP